MYQHILVAVELTEDIDDVIQQAAELVNALNAKLSLIHVVKPIKSGIDIAQRQFSGLMEVSNV